MRSELVVSREHAQQQHVARTVFPMTWNLELLHKHLELNLKGVLDDTMFNNRTLEADAESQHKLLEQSKELAKNLAASYVAIQSHIDEYLVEHKKRWLDKAATKEA